MTKDVSVGSILLGFVVFVIWIIVQLWYIFVSIIAIVVIVYLLKKHFDHKKEERERERNLEKYNILEQQRLETEQKQKEIQEKQRLEEKAQQELREEKRKQELYQLEQNRIKERMTRFSLSERDAQLIFGKVWKKRLCKPDMEFTRDEVLGRLREKMSGDNEEYMNKIYNVAEKVLDLIDYYVQWMGKQNGWDDVDFDNWGEDWNDVRVSWAKTKHEYSSEKSREKRKSDSDDYYEILGVSRDDTIKEIKARYRKLMLEFHPDKNNSKNAEEKCKKINKAYEILSDPEKKSVYDTYGIVFE